MADAPKKTPEDASEQTLIDAFFSYLRERVDSPFLFCFLLSWVVINRDFCLYFLLQDNPNKSFVLANWDFRGDFLGMVLVDCGNSILNPLLYGLITAIAFPPFSFLISAAKYKCSAWSRKMAYDYKSDYDKALELSVAGLKIQALNNKISKLENDIRIKKGVVEEEEKKIDNAGYHLRNVEYRDILRIVVDSAKISKEYNENKDAFELIEQNFISPNCIVTFNHTDIDGTTEVLKIPVFGILLDKRFFNFEDPETTRFVQYFLYSSLLNKYTIKSPEGERTIELKSVEALIYKG